VQGVLVAGVHKPVYDVGELLGARQQMHASRNGDRLAVDLVAVCPRRRCGSGAERVFEARAGDCRVVDAEELAEVALRVGVDEQDLAATCCERGPEVGGGGGLADATLVVGNHDHERHPGQPRSGTETRAGS
jgi:hypothetical protein